MLGVKMLGDEKVAIEDYPEPIQKQGEILIQIKASGICGSEMHGYRSQSSQSFNGGHEMAGVVSMLEIQNGSKLGITLAFTLFGDAEIANGAMWENILFVMTD